MTEIKHYGTPRKSGRYPWGSGDNAYQRNPSIRAQIKELKKQGLTEKQIADGFKMSTTQLRAEISLEKAEERQANSAFAQRLLDKGYSKVAIAERMGRGESYVRSLLDPAMQERALIVENTASMLKNQLKEKRYLDIGLGTEIQAGVTRTQLNVAIAELKKEGYKVQYITTPQPGGKKTSVKVLTPPDVTYQELYKNRDKIKMIDQWSDDGGRTYNTKKPPTNISKDRVAIKYGEDGGADMDGVIQLRRGVEDISLGDKHYAQVRIAVGGTHYIKGMAIYSDDLPDGVDILFNTNKSKDTPIYGAKDNSILKPLTNDPLNPFNNAEYKQKDYISKDGSKKLSALNIVNEEGSWDSWSRTLSSQFLSKQSPALAKQQLDLDIKIKKEEFDDYNSLTNPTVKKKLLLTYADECDSDAVHLKAAAMPRQGNFVILPSNDLKPTEVFAPKYNNGESVVLIRHPHGGIFEIPQLTVNNNNPKVRSILGNNPIDGIAINPKVAKKLSGADFDGDTVLVIPIRKSNEIKISNSLKGLADFDPKIAYPYFEGMKVMTKGNKQTEMGKISNLITDMTIKGASQDEIARAVRHSMVVIDAEKHNLNYKQSYIDNGIAQLKEIYQGGSTKGASTLISRASSQMRVDKRKDIYKIDPETGKKIFEPIPEYKINKKTGELIPNSTYINKKGKVVKKKTLTTKMYEVEDAFELSSGTRMETIYANYANTLKAMGDQARKIAVNTPPIVYSPSANKAYKPQVESLLSKLSVAISNKPLERQALLLADTIVNSKRQSNPDLTAKEISKIRGQQIAETRKRVGALKTQIKITPLEWEAIQAGAISNSRLSDILNNTDLELVKSYATPRQKTGISAGKLSRARTYFNSGYTQAEVAQMLGVSVNSLMQALNG